MRSMCKIDWFTGLKKVLADFAYFDDWKASVMISQSHKAIRRLIRAEGLPRPGSLFVLAALTLHGFLPSDIDKWTLYLLTNLRVRYILLFPSVPTLSEKRHR